MNKTLIAILMTLVIAAVLVVVFYGFPKTQPVPESAQQNQDQSGATPATVSENLPSMEQTSRQQVEMKNFSFQPSVLTVKAGTTVVWINRDAANHDVKSELFSSPLFGQDKSFEFLFSAPGTYDYVCTVHPSMKGQIIVQ